MGDCLLLPPSSAIIRTRYLPVKASTEHCCLLEGLCQNSPLPSPLHFGLVSVVIAATRFMEVFFCFPKVLSFLFFLKMGLIFQSVFFFPILKHGQGHVLLQKPCLLSGFKDPWRHTPIRNVWEYPPPSPERRVITCRRTVNPL